MSEENILSQEEVDALLNAVESGDVAFKKTEKKKVCVTYDFRNPILIPKEVVRILRVIHENFARNFSLSLSGYLRNLVQVELVSVDQLTYNEFMLSLPSVTYLNVVSMSPLKGNIVLEINVNMVLLFVERLLGGESKRQVNPRPLTDVEMAISQRIAEKMLREYSAVWKHIIDFRPRIESGSTDPRFAQIVKPEELVLLVCFELHIGGTSGILNICFPISSFEPVIGLIAQRGAKKGRFIEKEGMTDMQSALLNAPIATKAKLDTFKASIEEVTGLKEGDIIRLGKKTKEGSDFVVGSRSLYKADISSYKHRKTVILRDKY